MSKKTNASKKKAESVKASTTQIAKNKEQNMPDKYAEQLAELTIYAGHETIDTIKQNSSDYKAIDADPTLSTFEKAREKRILVLLDIGLVTTALGSVMLLTRLAKRCFIA